MSLPSNVRGRGFLVRVWRVFPNLFLLDAGDMQYVLSGQQQSSGAADDVKVCIIIFCGSKAPSKELKATQCHLLRLRKEDHAVTRPALFGNINLMLRNSMFSALFDKHADQLQADMEHTVERISSLMQDELTHAMERVDHIMRDSRCWQVGLIGLLFLFLFKSRKRPLVTKLLCLSFEIFNVLQFWTFNFVILLLFIFRTKR